MPTTVTLKNLASFAGATNLQLFLRKTSDNTLLAAGGDTGVDADSIGSFAWTIAEEIPSEQLLARIYEGATETKENIIIDSVLNVGFTEIGQEAAELNTEGRTAIADAVDTKLSDTHGDGSWGGGGGSGGGSPVFTAVVVARIATGSAAGWPEDFTIGDAYLTENAGAQPLFIKDVADNILSGLGTKNFSDPDFVGALRLAPLTDGTRTLDTPPTTIEVKSTDDVGIVYNDDTAGAEYFELQIPRAKTLMGVTKTKYSCQFIMNWGIDNTFERTVNLGEIKFLRKNAPAT